MKNALFFIPAGCLLAGLLAAPWMLHGAEPGKTADKSADKSADKPAEKTTNGEALETVDSVANVADVRDPAFDRYVNLTLLGKAWEAQDAALLTDTALQLAEGERVLLRTHKSGLTAERMLGLAAKLAADSKDKASLERVGKAAQARGDQKLAAAVALASKVGAESRDLDPALLLPVDSTTPEEFALFRQYLKDIRAAKLGGDAATLEVLEKETLDLKGLASERRDYLARLAKEARAALPANDPKAKLTYTALLKLSSASRDGDYGFQLTGVYNGPAQDAGLEVNDVIYTINSIRIHNLQEERAALANCSTARMVVLKNTSSGYKDQIITVTPRNGKINVDGTPVDVDALPAYNP